MLTMVTRLAAILLWTAAALECSVLLPASRAVAADCSDQARPNVLFIAVFQVNRETGGLTFSGHYTPVGNPSCIVFLDLAREIKVP